MPLAVRTSWRRWLLLCRVKAERAYRDSSYGFVVPKLLLYRAKAVRTYRAVAKAISNQSCADVSDGS